MSLTDDDLEIIEYSVNLHVIRGHFVAYSESQFAETLQHVREMMKKD